MFCYDMVTTSKISTESVLKLLSFPNLKTQTMWSNNSLDDSSRISDPPYGQPVGEDKQPLYLN